MLIVVNAPFDANVLLERPDSRVSVVRTARQVAWRNSTNGVSRQHGTSALEYNHVQIHALSEAGLCNNNSLAVYYGEISRHDD